LNPTRQTACVIFQKLVVNNIEDSSGIFIGTNQAIGWSSLSKSNQGFGSIKDAAISHSVSVVNDQDRIDMPVREARYITSADTAGDLRQCAIDFQAVNVNSISTGSAIDLGDNDQPGWRSARKVNYGSGKNMGTGRFSKNASFVIDNDGIDAPFRTEGYVAEAQGGGRNHIRIVQKAAESGSAEPLKGKQTSSLRTAAE
jgi:hypothetical protein